MGCRSLLQGILLTWRANLRLLRFLHCRRAVYRWATRGAQGTGESGANMEVLGPDLLGQTPLHLSPSQSRNRLLSHLSSPRPHNIASHFLLSTAGMVTLHTPWSCLRMEQKDRNYTLTPWLSDSATAWTVAHQAPLSMRFFRWEYWSGLPFSSPEDLPLAHKILHIMEAGFMLVYFCLWKKISDGEAMWHID